MNIFISGGSGFIGNYLSFHLGLDHKVYNLPRRLLELTDQQAVDRFFAAHQIDVTIHAAAIGASQRNISGIYEGNVEAFNNVARQSVKKFINIDSGAIFDKTKSIHSESIYNTVSEPYDEYGKSKLHNARKTLSMSNGLNMRLYGCFGVTEGSHRFISTCVENALQDNDTIVKDMFFDYFYIKDVYNVINYALWDYCPKDIDLVYANSGFIKLSMIAHLVYAHLNSSGKVIIESNSIKSYCGDHRKLNSLPIKLTGLNNGIIETIDGLCKRML